MTRINEYSDLTRLIGVVFTAIAGGTFLAALIGVVYVLGSLTGAK